MVDIENAGTSDALESAVVVHGELVDEELGIGISQGVRMT